MSKKIWEIKIEEDGGDLVLPFPADLLEAVGWKEGDELEWIMLPDGTASLTKVGKNEMV